MKYKRPHQIVEDKELFNSMSAYRMSKITGISQAFLSKVRNEKVIPSEKWYLEFKKKIETTT